MSIQPEVSNAEREFYLKKIAQENTPERQLIRIVTAHKNSRIDIMWDREEKKWKLALGSSFTKFSGETLSEVIKLALAKLENRSVDGGEP